MSKGKKDEPPVFKEGYTAFEAAGSSPVASNQREVDSSSVQEELVRTQVYLSVDQREFLREEGRKRGVSMAAALREIINERMKPAVVNWDGNPLLDEVVVDPEFNSTGTGSIDADASIYGKYQP